MAARRGSGSLVYGDGKGVNIPFDFTQVSAGSTQFYGGTATSNSTADAASAAASLHCLCTLIKHGRMRVRGRRF